MSFTNGQVEFAGKFGDGYSSTVLALTTGAMPVTRDKDFIKIPYLKTFNPLAVNI